MKSKWADYAPVQEECGNLSGNKLTRNSSGSRNTRLQLFQLAEPLWTDPGLKSGISLCELISTLKKRKRTQGMNCQTFSQKPRTRGKHHHYHHISKDHPSFNVTFAWFVGWFSKGAQVYQTRSHQVLYQTREYQISGCSIRQSTECPISSDTEGDASD